MATKVRKVEVGAVAEEPEEGSSEPIVVNATSIISAATPFEKVLKADKAGQKLCFSTESIKELSDKELGKLSGAAVLGYFHAKKAAELREEEPPIDGFDINPSLSMARAQLNVVGKEPGRRYAWKRPDETQMCRVLGYRLESNPKLGVFNRTKGGTAIVGTCEKPELLLWSIPEEKACAMEAAVVARSRRDDEAVENSTIDSIAGQGLKAYVTKEE